MIIMCIETKILREEIMLIDVCACASGARVMNARGVWTRTM